MTIDEMITDFTEQQSKVKAEVAEIKDALKTIEGLRLATQDGKTEEAPTKPAKVK